MKQINLSDEEIEKTLKCCDSKDWKCDECPIAQKCKKMAGDISFFYRQVIKYINRLKAENGIVKQLRLYLMDEKLLAERRMQRKLDSGVCSAEFERGEKSALAEILDQLDKYEDEARK